MRTTKAILGQSLFLTLALVLPSITHRIGLNYLVAQPMHWMILFAGLAYGPFSGLSIPVLSFLKTGMPMPAILLLMLPELAVYGFVTGLFKNKLTGFCSLAIALITGRLVYLVLFAMTGQLDVSFLTYVKNILAHGFFAMILQIALLPVLSGLYIKWVKD
jgi:hypothetical protein